MEEGLERGRAADRQLRLALVAGGHADPRALFPDELGKPPEAGQQGLMPSSGADLSGLRWESPGEDGAQRDTDLLRRVMRENRVTTITQEPDMPHAPPAQVSLDYP